MSGGEIVVIGAGVIGLTSAVVLQEAGFDVLIVAERPPLETNSANSGAIWGPFLSMIDPRLLEWSFATLEQLKALSGDIESGVRMTDGVGAADFPTVAPDWVVRLGGDFSCDLSLLPTNYLCGWSYTVPIVDIPIYLVYLQRRFELAGGRLELRSVGDLSEFQDVRCVVNCAGLGAGPLASDETLTPSKGQLVVVENPGISSFFAERGDGPDLLYILPQGDKLVLGGTAEWEFDHDRPDEQAVAAIITRCGRVDPRILNARVLSVRSGLRPCRDNVRLEADHSGLSGVVHNYGHGGSGVSLSWACAFEVLALVQAAPLSGNREVIHRRA